MKKITIIIEDEDEGIIYYPKYPYKPIPPIIWEYDPYKYPTSVIDTTTWGGNYGF